MGLGTARRAGIDGHHLRLGPIEGGKGRLQICPYRQLPVQLGMLVEVTPVNIGLPEDIPGVRLALPLEQLEQGTFADAVPARDADMFAGKQGEAGVLIQCLVTEVTGQMVNAEQTHGAISIKKRGRYLAYRPPFHAILKLCPEDQKQKGRR
ncbi:hypothetical protein D3C79_644690 [compost metagenome]